MIELVNVHKTFRGQVVLRNVNLRIEDGETIVIIGRSGGGKSVMLKNIVGLYKPDSGKVLIDGIDIVPLKERELMPIRKNMGMLFQNSALFDSMSVFDNVAFPLREMKQWTEAEIEEKVHDALEMVSLGSAGPKMPSQLSGGMRKRIGLARAIVYRPKIIFYDEPTTGLDPITSDSINNLIVLLSKKLQVTSIIVTHDMQSAYKIADRIAMLHDGNVLTSGTPEEIRKHADPLVQKFINGVSDPQDIEI